MSIRHLQGHRRGNLVFFSFMTLVRKDALPLPRIFPGTQAQYNGRRYPRVVDGVAGVSTRWEVSILFSKVKCREWQCLSLTLGSCALLVKNSWRRYGAGMCTAIYARSEKKDMLNDLSGMIGCVGRSREQSGRICKRRIRAGKKLMALPPSPSHGRQLIPTNSPHLNNDRERRKVRF